MNKLRQISTIVFATFSTCTFAAAADRFDSPGPGYHEQIERAFGKLTKDGVHFAAPIIRIVPSSFPTPELRSFEWPVVSPAPYTTDAFSQPIRITIDNSATPASRSEKRD